MELVAREVVDYSSDEGEAVNVSEEVVDIPDCEGIPREQWMTNVVTLYNDVGIPVAEGICHSVRSDLVLGCNGPLGDSLVAVQISKSLDPMDVPDEWKYSLRAWPIKQTYLNGASLHDHEVRFKYELEQSNLTRPPPRIRAPYGTPHNKLVRRPQAYLRTSLSTPFQARIVALATVSNLFRGQKSALSDSGCTTRQRSNFGTI
jgi:hypothetical protein